MRKFLMILIAVVFTTGTAFAERYVMVTHGEGKDPFWPVVQKGGEDAARAVGADFEYIYNPSADMADMASSIQAAAATQPDGMVISLPDPDALGSLAFPDAALRLHADLRYQTPQALAAVGTARLVADRGVVRLYRRGQSALPDQFLGALPSLRLRLLYLGRTRFYFFAARRDAPPGPRALGGLRHQPGSRDATGCADHLAEAGDFGDDLCHRLLRLHRP